MIRLATFLFRRLKPLFLLGATPYVLLAQHSGMAHVAASAVTPTLRLITDQAQREIIVEIGPIDLPNDAGHIQLPPFHTQIPIDGWLHGFYIDLVDGNGRPVPRQILHHVNVIEPDRRELFSPIMLRLAAAGQETDPVKLPWLLGYRVRKGQEFIVTSMMHNPTGREYDGVRLRVHFPYTTGGLIKPISIFPFYMDVMPPASRHSYDLPPGKSTRSWEARPVVSGRIIGIGGHVHQYGTSLRLEDLNTRKVIWAAQPAVGKDGQISSMPMKTFITRLGVPIKEGHVYRVTAEYDNTSGQTIPGGAMGALGGAFIPSSRARWPRVDRNDPQLKIDWELVHTGPGEGHVHGGS
ncbi:MAG TPA: hypothetical protein VIF83_01795 [Gemmatimonadaceae bacterium]|jgi:hypothetical protein